MKATLFVAAGLSASLLLAQPTLAQNASNTMMKSMQSGMNQMMSMKMTGDPDHDFAMMMKVHHQGAVEMADLEIKQGSDARTKALATTIKAGNQREIKEFDQFINNHKPMATSSKMGQGSMNMMDKGKPSMTGKTDHDFASMMIQHHQQAIDMSEAFLKKGKTTTMKTIANSIIKQQTKEIAELKNLEVSLKG